MGRKIRNWAVAELIKQGFYTTVPHDQYHATIVPVTGCNLTCSYCVQNVAATQTRSRPTRIPARVINENTIYATMDFLKNMMCMQSCNKLSVCIFGGEPLLRGDLCVLLLQTLFATFDVVNASMVSNGTLLTRSQAHALQSAGLTSIQLTFDGPEHYHDAIRSAPATPHTYKTIMGNLLHGIEEGLRIGLRLNIAKPNMGTWGPVLSEIAELTDPSMITVDFAVVEDIGVGYSDGLTLNSYSTDLVLQDITAALDFGFHMNIPAQGKCVYCDYTSGRRGAIINADGHLYPCWDAIGRSEFSEGDVWRGFCSADSTRLAKWTRCGDAAYCHEELNDIQADLSHKIADLLIDRYADTVFSDTLGVEDAASKG